MEIETQYYLLDALIVSMIMLVGIGWWKEKKEYDKIIGKDNDE